MDEKSKGWNWKIILSFAAIYIIWGSTYLAALIALKGFPPFIMATLRFLTAGVLLFAWCRSKQEKIPSWKNLKINMISGIVMLVGGTVAVIWAVQYIPSGLAAIIVAALPFWFVLLDKQQWPNYFSNKAIIGGIVLGFTGIIILFSTGHPMGASTASTGKQMISILLLITGGICWALGSLYSKANSPFDSSAMNASIQLIAAGIFCFMISVSIREINSFSFRSVPVDSWISLIYLTVMGSLVAYLAYIWLLTVRPAAQVGTYAYVNPVIAVLLGWSFAGERISSMQIMALALILIGVLLVNLPKYNFLKMKP